MTHHTKLSYHPWTFLWTYIGFYKPRFTVLLVCIFIWAVNESLFPYFIKLTVDIMEATPPQSHDIWLSFKMPLLGIIISYTLMEASMRLYGWIEANLLPEFKAAMRTDVFTYVKDQSLEYHAKSFSGNTGSKVADIPRTSEDILQNLFWHVIAIGFVFLLSVIVVAQVNIVFCGLILGWCVVHLGIVFCFRDNVNIKISEHYHSLAELNGQTIDILANSTIMRLFARHNFETDRLNRYQRVEVKRGVKSLLYMEKINFLKGLTDIIFIFTTIYFLLQGWRGQWIHIGDLPLIAMTSFNLMGLIGQMGRSLVDLVQDMGSLRGALTLLQTRHSVVDHPSSEPLVIKKGAIEFKSVGFGYNPIDPLFKDLSVTINAQEKVGLVGFSGSGKTTFINLLLREYDVTAGEIFIDKKNIAGVTLQSLREHISIIPQDPHLFHRSIRENIIYGRLNATDNEIIEAATKAHCHEFIMKLEHGYDTVVGERGSKLSGGQRQRLAIARAILKDAPLLFLDEATSALDSATENAIHDSLINLMENRTTIVIAHRLSTLKMMNRIIVFNKGTIVESGTHAELLELKGFFHYLSSLQQEGFLPEKDTYLA